MTHKNLALLGFALMTVGVFSPVVTLPFVGNMNYFLNGRGDGVVLLVLVCIGVAFTLAGNAGGVLWTGGGCFLVMTFTFLRLLVRINQIQNEIDNDTYDDILGYVARGMMTSVQIQWAWLLLFGGAGCVIVAAWQAPTRAVELQE